MVKIISVEGKIKYISVDENDKHFNNNVVMIMIKESEKNLSYTQFINRYLENINDLITKKKVTFNEKVFSIHEYKENKYIEEKYIAKYKKLKLKKY